MTLDGYNATYGTDEVSQPYTDFVTAFGAGLVTFAGLFALAYIYKYARKNRLV